MRTLAIVPLLLVFLAPAISTAAPREEDWHRLIGILQYLEADYPLAVESRSDFELAEQRSFIAEALAGARDLGASAEPAVAKLETLKERVDRGEAPEEVREGCQALIEELVRLGGLVRSPRHPPDLERGRALFAESCAACHGAEGRGDTPVAATMNPPPASFHDPEVMGPLSPYKAFNTISFGVTGTAMPGFPSLDENDRWSLAFFVHSLRHPRCAGNPTRVSVKELATSSDDALAAAYGDDAVGCLRSELPRIDPAQSLLAAETGVKEAVRLAASGDAAAARRKLLDAYLGGVEPVELMIGSRDAGLVREIEAVFLGMRFDLDQGKTDLGPQAEALFALLERAERATVPASASVAFWGALLVIVREGFEAMIVVAALLAVLKRMKQTTHARVVHAGWASALGIGVVTFLFGRKLLSGFNPEWVEGIAALVAVGMLLYHTAWLNARSHVAEYMKEIREKMEGAVGRGSALGLFAIAFTAVFRECVEVVLFLQGLSVDSPSGVAWGSAAGLATLLVLVLLVQRVGYKLPMKPLFRASTVLLFATAVVLLGKGIHAMQAVGALPVRPLPLFSVDLLGIFPDAFGLSAQVLLALSPLVWTRLRRPSRKGAEPVAVA
ncbi:FTR1 family protein [Vulgatibacter incomptus]|uniref:Cytochrome c, class I n=1 Tax=Vulgatibacter incomptus TaxID=1391653 RepID=A0A0K1PIF4_9BACT|nr:FTR1 family protein [Vulgatibacter incomptus]AKU93295.1 Cytochrome c, class I [Vulgatibacter incomptus]